MSRRARSGSPSVASSRSRKSIEQPWRSLAPCAVHVRIGIGRSRDRPIMQLDEIRAGIAAVLDGADVEAWVPARHPPAGRRIVAALSGGVDSAVAAALL